MLGLAFLLPVPSILDQDVPFLISQLALTTGIQVAGHDSVDVCQHPSFFGFDFCSGLPYLVRQGLLTQIIQEGGHFIAHLAHHGVVIYVSQQPVVIPIILNLIAIREFYSLHHLPRPHLPQIRVLQPVAGPEKV